MAFGKIKVDDIIYTDINGNATEVPVEDLATAANGINTNSGNITTNATNIATNTTDIATNTTNIASNTSAIATKAPLASPQFTGIPVATGDGSSTDGQIQLNCSQNTHGVKIKSPPHSAGASYTLTLPDTTGTTGQFLQTDGSGALSWDSVDLSSKADLASPTFTGTPAAPTATGGDSSTQIATTAFVAGEVRTDVEIQGLADGQIAADLAAATPTIQAYDADTAKTDVVQNFTAAQRGAITTLTSGANVAPNFSSSNNFTLTLGENLQIDNPTNLGVGQSGSIFLVQDTTGGRTAAWDSYWKFAGGTAPTLSTAANAVDRVDYIVQSSTSIHAVVTLAYS